MSAKKAFSKCKFPPLSEVSDDFVDVLEAIHEDNLKDALSGLLKLSSADKTETNALRVMANVCMKMEEGSKVEEKMLIDLLNTCQKFGMKWLTLNSCLQGVDPKCKTAVTDAYQKSKLEILKGLIPTTTKKKPSPAHSPDLVESPCKCFRCQKTDCI